MKNSPTICPRHFSRGLFPLLAAMMLVATVARAGLTVDIHLYHDSWGYYFYPLLNANTNPPDFPDGHYLIASPQVPTGGSQLQYQATNNTLNYLTGGGNYYGDFDSFLSGITNGQWSIWVTNSTSTNHYQFTVTVTGVTSNSFGAPAVAVFPTNGAPFVTNQPLFQWMGPANWAGTLNVSDNFIDTSGNWNYEASASLPPNQTSWPCPTVLPNGTNDFSADYSSNVTAQIVASTPRNGAQPISGWVSTATMETRFTFDSQFTVGQLPMAGGGHTLVAHYTFDNSSNLGQDSSGNGNDMSGETYWGPQHVFNTDAEAGGGAVQFFGTDAMTAGEPALDNLNRVLAGSFTFSAWVKTTVTNGVDYNNAFFGAAIFWAYNDHGNINDTIPLSITGSKAAFTTRGGDSGASDNLHSLTSVNDGNYHLITVTRDQGTGEKQIYVDGNFENSGIGTTNPLNGNNYNLTIGGWDYILDRNSTVTNYSSYKGLLDDFQIYSGVLSASEVAYLYNHPGTNVANISGGSQDLNTALGTTNLNWTSSGDSSWFVETTNTYNGAPAAAQSGSVIDSQSSTLSVTVTGPGTLTFYWSSIAEDPNQGFDYEFYIDDPSFGDQADLYGDNSWQQVGPISIPSGQHTLGWVVNPYGDTDSTQAGFLDQVSFVPDLTPVITLNPFSQTNYPGYNVALLAAATNSSSITWQWFKVGSANPIPNATNALFIPTNSGTAGVAGSYYAVASSPAGSANTTTASVSFVSAPLPPDWTHAVKSPFFPVNGAEFNKDYYLGCAVDSAGDIYAAAFYVGNMNVVTNGNDANVLTAVGANGAALVKHDANGNALWAVGLTNNQSASSSYGQCVALAPGNGAYLASILSGTNWLGTNKFVDAGGGSILLSRFDAGGSNVWSKLIGGTNSVGIDYNMLVSDASGNVTMAGNMSGTVSFGGTNLSAPSGGGFIVQYDANGAVRWAQTIPVYAYNLAYGNGLLYVSLQSAVASGVTNASIGSLSNVTDRAWAVACLNATNGQAIWLRGVGSQYGANFAGLINDMPLISVSGSNVFLTANAFGASVVFGGIAVPLPGGRGQYFARYDTNGNPQAAVAFGNPTTMLFASAANASGVYVSGDFDSYSQFGNLVIAAPVYGTNDLDVTFNGFSFIWFTQPFVAKFDLNGNPLWARNGVSSAFANFRGIATTSDGVWASGFLKVKDITSPAQFGTNFVSSDLYVPGGGLSTIIFTQAGMIAKIGEAAVASPVTLLNPHDDGVNFQFRFMSQSGFNHNILYRTNLVVGNWLTNSTVAGDGTLKTSSIPLSVFSPAKQGFIRVSTQ